MSISEIQGLSPAALADLGRLRTQTSAVDDVYRSLVDKLQSLSTEMAGNREVVADMALGDVDNLHRIIIGMERTRLDFEIVMSIRNRALEAYQELMRMQV